MSAAIDIRMQCMWNFMVMLALDLSKGKIINAEHIPFVHAVNQKSGAAAAINRMEQIDNAVAMRVNARSALLFGNSENLYFLYLTIITIIRRRILQFSMQHRRVLARTHTERIETLDHSDSLSRFVFPLFNIL